MNDIECPKCKSKYIRCLALHNFVPLSEQFMYQCGDCNEMFGRAESLRESLQDSGIATTNEGA